LPNSAASDTGKPEGEVMNKCYLELEVQPHYHIYGEHRPATRDDPAEEPEIDLYKVTIGDIDISSQLSKDEKGLAMDWCIEDAERQAENEQAAKDDYEYEKHREKCFDADAVNGALKTLAKMSGHGEDV